MELDDAQTRAADYLDDKLQTAGDLESLDGLLATIHTQHGQLKKQLDDAQRDLDAAKQASHQHQTTLRDRAHAFRAQQADIDQRLLVLTDSETSDEAVPRFEAVLDTLQRLAVANDYVELLAEVHVLRYDVRGQHTMDGR
jgi:chromosome segregation ATPase